MYAPLQYISAVVEGGPAAEASIKPGDRLTEVNGISVEGADHQKVVDLIKSSGNSVRLTVLSVTSDEASRLEQDSHTQAQDSFDMRSVPVQIPSFDKKTGQDGKEFVVYNVTICNQQTCSRRYREFFSLDGNLKRQFVDYVFPPLPGRWPFKLNDVALDGRRRKLQEYMEKVCSVKLIFESDLMQDFLDIRNQKKRVLIPAAVVDVVQRPTPQEVEICLPNRSAVSVDLQVHSRALEVYNVLCAKLGLNQDSLDQFALYYKVDNNFYCKMSANEFPLKFVENDQKIFIRKWVFSPTVEREMFSNPQAMKLLFDQAVSDIEDDILSVPKEVSDKMKDFEDNPQKFLKGLGKLDSYNKVTFPHCPCDARKNGHIIVSLSKEGIALKACSNEGVAEEQEQVFSWDRITATDGDDEGEAFMLQYQREGKGPKWIKVYTPHYQYMSECAEKIKSQL